MIHPFSTDFEEPTPAERRNGYVVCAAVIVAVLIVIAVAVW